MVPLYILDGEEHIVQAAIEGESSAFGKLYDHYHPAIYRFVAFKVGRREDAEDITHQVFLKAWLSVERYQSKGFPFSSWLYRIARNHVIDFYRSDKQHTPIDDVAHELIGDDVLVESVEQGIALERVTSALTELKDEYQDVIILRFIEERSLKETAVSLERSVGAVKVLQHRAMHQLRTLLDDSESSHNSDEKS